MPEITRFVGVDVGREGGIALMDGDTLSVWPMPPKANRGIDLRMLEAIVMKCAGFGTKAGIEQNTGRPNQVPDLAYRFGLQEGQLHAMFFCHGFEIDMIPPQVWKLKLGLRGKVDDPHSRDGERYFLEHYPKHPHLLYGPRGGILDGILDALLICHFQKLVYSSPVGKFGIRKPPRIFGLPPDE